MTGSRLFTVGAVLAEQAVDERSYVFIVRAEPPVTACRDLERRLLGQRLAGYTTLIVDLVGERVSGRMLATLLRAQRKIESRNGRQLVSAETPEIARALQCAELELIDANGDTLGGNTARLTRRHLA